MNEPIDFKRRFIVGGSLCLATAAALPFVGDKVWAQTGICIFAAFGSVLIGLALWMSNRR